MTTLHTRLLAAVQQRMDVARAAGSTSRPSPRMVGRYAEWHAEPYYTSEDVSYAVVIQPPLGQIVPASMEAHIAEHIAANDPATVLRHCERDLRVLERHRRMKRADAEDEIVRRLQTIVTVEAQCLHGRTNGLLIDWVPWPCPEIVDLCSAYAIEVS